MLWKSLFAKLTGRNTTFEHYCDLDPAHQNAIDLMPAWVSAFPATAGVKAGSVPLFDDGRIHQAIAAAGSIEGAKVLEIGPLEAMHTHILNSHRPERIDCIEANKGNYLRCLITKEILQLDRARFYLGDAARWLETTPEHYDFAVASGVLYHMRDPAHFLSHLLRKCDRLFIWTHYYDEALVNSGDTVTRKRFTGSVHDRSLNGLRIRYVERRYGIPWKNLKFCGGLQNTHYWMYRADIISLIESEGFGDFVFSHEDPHHEGGPCLALSCRRL